MFAHCSLIGQVETWSPATPDELLHRVKYIPENSVWTVSTMGAEANKIGYFSYFHGW